MIYNIQIYISIPTIDDDFPILYFTGYFDVNNQNVITSFYDSSNPTVNVLDMTNWRGSDNIFNQTTVTFSPNGTSINALFIPGDTSQPVMLTSNGFTITTESGYAGYYVITLQPYSCYDNSSHILTLSNSIESYRQINTLKPGDLIKVYPSGYKPIKLIGYQTLINYPTDKTTMYIMKKTENNKLTQDLILTGLHLVKSKDESFNYIIDGVKLIYVKKSKLFKKIEDVKEFTIYHLVLESEKDKHFCIWANGIISESTNEKHFLRHNFTLI